VVRRARLIRALGVADVDRFERKNYCYSVKVRDIVRLIEKDGWYWVRTKGSHHQYKHPTKPGLVTIPGNPGDDVASGTLNNILKQAGLKS
jgi:predicted RNA binding protein YcfA (HicA-like mRNA interferase family)